MKKDFSIYACKLLTTRICNEWRKESECNLLLKFGIVCEKCIIKNELSWDQAYNLIHDRWNKRHIIGMINFEELEITKEEFMTHQNIVNGSTLTCADNEREVYMEDNSVALVEKTSGTSSQFNIEINEKINKKSRDENYLFILTKKLAFTLKQKKGVSYEKKKKFLKDYNKKYRRKWDNLSLRQL